MSGIVLSSSVRQNLLSLQSTADLLATTQNRLATGKKVNTAPRLRSSDINNLLDGIGNGVQVLQAANTGITSLQSLVDSAKSVANQALQTQVGYSSKSSFSVSLGAGATASDLFAGASYTAATLTGQTVVNDKTAAPPAVTAATSLTASTAADSITATIAAGDTLTVDGHTITFKTGAPPAAGSVTAGSGVLGNIVTDGSGNSSVYLNGGAGNAGDLLTAVDLATGVKTASNAADVATIATATGATAGVVTAGAFVISTGTAADLSISSSNATLLASLGIGNGSATTSLARTPSTNSNLAIGTVLDIAAVGTGTATAITFGKGAGQVKDLNGLNAALASNNLQATVDASGTLTIQTNNDNASLQIGALTGSTNLFAGKSASAPVQDPAAQATRADGVNLLNGDSLKLVFNETGKSTLNITGTTFDAAGLGLANLTVGSDFIDNNATNKVLTSRSSASDSLRSEASSLGSNLSIVQIRQDFSKNLINVLQTGSSNLTLADTNEEAANSQALSTRQSIAVSALALANQSQQSVLQLLR
ncbi:MULTISPECIES: DUF1522 domain-containing protein [Bradyrhizobium]|jgi:flagellin|uniref:Flagellin C-terminal helical region n=2 Tax=Bradyrhizobium TaxID=374 RepID=A0ABY0PXZ6_9BRAD|nr:MULTISPECIES: DUF1522 domain-containing protein [Bradyrhizobium]SDJ09230.1 flagellin C-terminal helical region [Bradyrhizobium ottawaense]SEC94108.1 flagellin C-terminal helical region [Bradyrhizobium lablabi]SHL01373.1 flagellin C-terminal helical region [Bradyrhizobium lablabi]